MFVFAPVDRIHRVAWAATVTPWWRIWACGRSSPKWSETWTASCIWEIRCTQTWISWPGACQNFVVVVDEWSVMQWIHQRPTHAKRLLGLRFQHLMVCVWPTNRLSWTWLVDCLDGHLLLLFGEHTHKWLVAARGDFLMLALLSCFCLCHRGTPLGGTSMRYQWHFTLNNVKLNHFVVAESRRPGPGPHWVTYHAVPTRLPAK